MNEPKLLPEPRQFQTPFFTNNWRQIQAQSSYNTEETKYIKVSGGIATIMGGNIIVRFGPVPLADGFYVIDKNEDFIPYDALTDYFGFKRSRDVDVLRPNIQTLGSTAPITKDEISNIVNFLEYVRKTGNFNKVLLVDDVIFVPIKPDLGIKISSQLPVKGDGLIFDAYHLKLAFSEMLRYDYVFIMRDNRPEVSAPLFIGLDWTHCALVGTSR